jgi:hypothetical protein
MGRAAGATFGGFLGVAPRARVRRRKLFARPAPDSLLLVIKSAGMDGTLGRTRAQGREARVKERPQVALRFRTLLFTAALVTAALAALALGLSRRLAEYR